jgi:hypothetical protein
MSFSPDDIASYSLLTGQSYDEVVGMSSNRLNMSLIQIQSLNEEIKSYCPGLDVQSMTTSESRLSSSTFSPNSSFQNSPLSNFSSPFLSQHFSPSSRSFDQHDMNYFASPNNERYVGDSIIGMSPSRFKSDQHNAPISLFSPTNSQRDTSLKHHIDYQYSDQYALRNDTDNKISELLNETNQRNNYSQGKLNSLSREYEVSSPMLNQNILRQEEIKNKSGPTQGPISKSFCSSTENICFDPGYITEPIEFETFPSLQEIATDLNCSLSDNYQINGHYGSFFNKSFMREYKDSASNVEATISTRPITTDQEFSTESKKCFDSKSLTQESIESANQLKFNFASNQISYLADTDNELESGVSTDSNCTYISTDSNKLTSNHNLTEKKDDFVLEPKNKNKLNKCCEIFPSYDIWSSGL